MYMQSQVFLITAGSGKCKRVVVPKHSITSVCKDLRGCEDNISSLRGSQHI